MGNVKMDGPALSCLLLCIEIFTSGLPEAVCSRLISRIVVSRRFARIEERGFAGIKFDWFRVA
jgi:hypothetical protein